MFAVYKLDPYRKQCPELLSMFQREKDAISFCDLYDWKVLDADTGLMFDMIIETKYERMLFRGNITMTKILSKCNIFKHEEK